MRSWEPKVRFHLAHMTQVSCEEQLIVVGPGQVSRLVAFSHRRRARTATLVLHEVSSRSRSSLAPMTTSPHIQHNPNRFMDKSLTRCTHITSSTTFSSCRSSPCRTK